VEAEREQTLEDCRVLDENLNDQIKYTADREREFCITEMTKTKADFSERLQNLHNKIIQVKSDCVIMNEKNREAFGITSPYWSPKATIPAINKVVEMMLQYLMVEYFIQNPLKIDIPQDIKQEKSLNIRVPEPTSGLLQHSSRLQIPHLDLGSVPTIEEHVPKISGRSKSLE